jgi:hypothetical protein
MYAAIGLVLMTVSETVQRAREHAAQRALEPIRPAKLPDARMVTSSPTSAPATATKAAD